MTHLAEKIKARHAVRAAYNAINVSKLDDYRIAHLLARAAELHQAVSRLQMLIMQEQHEQQTNK